MKDRISCEAKAAAPVTPSGDKPSSGISFRSGIQIFESWTLAGKVLSVMGSSVKASEIT